MNNEIMLAASIAFVVLYFFLFPKLKCKLVGHKLDNQVLWKTCQCCGKTFVLEMRTGKYVE